MMHCLKTRSGKLLMLHKLVPGSPFIGQNFMPNLSCSIKSQEPVRKNLPESSSHGMTSLSMREKKIFKRWEKKLKK